MDHTDAPPRRCAPHRARLVVPKAYTAVQTPTLEPPSAGHRDGLVRGLTCCEAEATEGRECVAFRRDSANRGRMDHTDAPPHRYAPHRARSVVPKAHTAGQSPTLGPLTAN